VLSKQERFAIFLARLEAAPPADSAESALALLSKLLTRVEDELSEIPENPSPWKSDGRMYPPQKDNARLITGYPGITRYRHVSHNTLIGPKGAIRIETLTREVLLDKPGADRKPLSLKRDAYRSVYKG
jgi:hypothetical protein